MNQSNNTETAVSPAHSGEIKLKRDGLAPIATPAYAEAFVTAYEGQISKLLPHGLKFDTFVAQARKAIVADPTLLQCTQASFLNALLEAAELGLDVSGSNGEAWIIPFNNNVAKSGQDPHWVKEATFIPGYLGFIKLTYMTGEVESVDGHIVFEDDEFNIEFGMQRSLRYVPNLTATDDDKRKVLGAYVSVHFKDGGIHYDYLTLAQLKKIHQASKAKNSPAWRNWLHQMYLGKAFKRVLKKVPKYSNSWINVARANIYSDRETDLQAETTDDQGRLEVINKKLKANPPQLSQPIAPSETVDESTGEISEPPKEHRTETEHTSDKPEMPRETPDSGKEQHPEPTEKEVFYGQCLDFFGEDKEGYSFRLVESVVGARPTAIDHIQENHAKKMNSIFRRCMFQYKPDVHPGKAKDFLKWVLDNKKALKKTSDVDKRKKDYDAFLEKPNDSEPQKQHSFQQPPALTPKKQNPGNQEEIPF